MVGTEIEPFVDFRIIEVDGTSIEGSLLKFIFCNDVAFGPAESSNVEPVFFHAPICDPLVTLIIKSEGISAAVSASKDLVSIHRLLLLPGFVTV